MGVINYQIRRFCKAKSRDMDMNRLSEIKAWEWEKRKEEVNYGKSTTDTNGTHY